MIFALVLLLLLALSALLNFGLIGRSFSVKGIHDRTAGPRLEEVVMEDNNARDKIAVVDIKGIITGRASTRAATTWWTSSRRN